MIRIYLLTAYRRLRRNRGQSVINLVGLTVGIASCLLIFLFVRHESAVDRHHSQADRIYRLNKVHTPERGMHEHHAVTSGMMGPTLAEEFPGVAGSVRLLPWFDDVVLTREPVSTRVGALVIADRSFFEVFDFRLLRGNPHTALAAPMSIVLTQDVADVLFSGEDPIGQTLTGLDNEDYTVTGVVARTPATSHLIFDALVSWSSTVPGRGPLEYHWMNNWITQSLYTYVVLAPASDPVAIERRLPDFMRRHFPERLDQYHLYLQPLQEVYLDSGHIHHARKVRSGNRTYVRVMSLIGGLVLFIAIVNFINLSTARTARRVRETGIRKALGASRISLAGHAIAEALILSSVATAGAAAAVAAAFPAFRTFTGRAMHFEPAQPEWLAGYAGIAVLVGIAAAAYPAAVQSSYSPLRALRSGAATGMGTGTGRARRTLVILQFTVSISLLIGTTLVYKQMRFVQKKDLGFESEQVLVLNTGGTRIEHQYEPFLGRLRMHPGIAHVSAGRNVPGHGTMEFSLEPEGFVGGQELVSPIFRITDPGMKDALGLRIKTGRFFAADRPAELQHGVVINDALARRLEWEEPVGRRLAIQGELAEGVVIGVVENFHFESLHRPIDPLAIIVDERRAGYVLVRVESGELSSTLDFIRREWESFESRYPFEYTFMDEAFGTFYATERKLMSTLGLFSLLAIGIACLGLWGLAAHVAEARTKEIGIRKVLGASVSRILVMLSRETVGLVLTSFAVAAPVSYLFAVRWLRNFAYQTDISPLVFAAAAFATLGLAVGTVSYQALRAATADPVAVLRAE